MARGDFEIVDEKPIGCGQFGTNSYGPNSSWPPLSAWTTAAAVVASGAVVLAGGAQP